MTEEQNFGDPEKLAEACRILGVDTEGKTSEQLQLECWKAIALKNADHVQRLLDTSQRYESIVDRLINLLERKEQDYQEQALNYARQLMELINQAIVPRDN